MEDVRHMFDILFRYDNDDVCNKWVGIETQDGSTQNRDRSQMYELLFRSEAGTASTRYNDCASCHCSLGQQRSFVLQGSGEWM